jgi:transcriptional regulator with XRE-family HTH domain
MDDLISKFAEARRAAGLSYHAAGAAMGIAPSTIMRWEKNGTVRSGAARQAMRRFIDDPPKREKSASTSTS